MHRQEAADPMPGAMGVIEPLGPEKLARQNVELAAARPCRKLCPRERDMPLQHQRETPPHLLAGSADGDRPGDVSRAVAILPA